MITRFPYYAAPAFNELRVNSDYETVIYVQEIGGQWRYIMLYSVSRQGLISFDLKNFVSKLFYDATEQIATFSHTGWAFTDHRLQVKYSVGGREFLALNAVQDKGHTLDLLEAGESGALTLRPIENRRIEVPKYEGFPVGVSLMYKNRYGLDYSNATKAVIETPASGFTVVLPWFYETEHANGGFISWGDGSVELMTAAGNDPVTLMRHTYSAPGQYEILWTPAPGVGQNISSYMAQPAAYAFGTTVRNYVQFSDQVQRFTASGNTGLQRVDGVLPALARTTHVFRGCTNLEYINPDFFLNVRTTLFDISYAFQGTSKLMYIDESLISGLAGVVNMSHCFESSGITYYSTSMFASMTKVVDCSYAFSSSKIQFVYSGMFARMRNLANVTGMFKDCKNISSIGSDVFNSQAAAIPAASICEGCTALTSIYATSFKGLTNITTFDRAFYGCGALTALPYGVFADMPKVTTFKNGCFRCVNLSSIPQNIFDAWTVLTADGMQEAFRECSKLSSIRGDLFRFNTTLTGLTQTFQGCKALRAIPLDFFRNMPQLRTATGTFSECGLTTLELGLFTAVADTLALQRTFAYNPFGANLPSSSGGHTLLSSKCTDVSGCFMGVKSGSDSEHVGPTKIPADILDVYASSSGINAANLFLGCAGITTVSANLFTTAGHALSDISSMFSGVGTPTAPFTIPPRLLAPLSNITSVSRLFYQANITDIPSDIFASMPQLTDASSCFSVYGKTDIPANLFANNTQLENVSNCFASSEKLTNIPANLFANNAKLRDASYCFSGGLNTGSLVSVPESLFDSCPLLENVSGIFHRQRNIENVGNIFRRNPLITNFSSAFSLNIGTGTPMGKLTGVSPVSIDGYKLWERAGKPGYPAAVSGFGCFSHNGTLYSDYAQIPTTWK